ncbi:protein L-Myc [Pelodiscus sinensis]|uniref:MYCL proto-onco, bHLH transcription factor n=1 Tax=Pelodiscus sinensis TaxID=13735 RepID=K7GG15_PELSI|nr:protein L-Myc [Pelodiscus sinensis]|eukprot:XP_006139201.1 protein L-Myc [Pelodiscus sinensis]
MEFDSHQHYFYDHDSEEDFYRSTAPSEDIWKKFELVATPRKAPPCPAGGKACCPGAGERSDRLSHCCLPGEEPEYLLGPGAILGNLSAFMLQDCMWSGFSARERLEKVMTEKLSTGAPRANPHKSPLAQDAGFNSPVSECVDPAAVFPCLPAETKPPPAAPGAERPCDSEGEEIDVVTVEKRQSLSMRKPVTITVRADPLDPCMKHFHISIHQQQHNYAARSPPDTCSQEDALEKEPKEEPLSSPEQGAEHSEPGLPKTGSTPSSDSEDMAKRKNHNYLERKRRNDLRSRFQALRDQVPGLANCPKTPKVVILSKAAEYLQSLVVGERRMAAEKRQLKLRQHQLLKRIAHLKGL